MRDTALTHFGLREPPFSKEVPDLDLWLPSSKQTVVDELCDVVESRSSAVLVGDPGVGKTCVLRALRKRLTPDDGMPVACALNFDHVALAQRARLGAVIATLPAARWPEIMRTLLIACGFEPTGT